LLGSLFGFDGFVNIPEGDTVDTIQLRSTDQMVKLPFQIRCDDYTESHHEDGTPREFRSTLTLLTPEGEPILTKDIIVNDPLRYQGISLYQASRGKMAPEPADGGQLADVEFSLNFQSSDSGMGYVRKLKMEDSVELPEKLGTFTLKHYLPRAQFGGQEIGEAVVGILAGQEGQEVQILLPLQFPKFDLMRQGSMAISVVDPPAGQVGGGQGPLTERFYTGLQVTKDPGVWVVYTGFLLMIGGCIITFFMPHQQVWVEIQPQGREYRVCLSAVAPRNKVGIGRKVQRLSEKLQQ
jgi:cytochrome c biogenesis protein